MIDALVLVGESRFGPTLGVEEAVRLADGEGVDRLVAAPARPPDYHLGPANERVAEAAARSGGRIAALGRVDPSDGRRAIAEARRCLEELECVGLFLHPFEEAWPITRSGAVLEVAVAAGVPVVVAAGHPWVSEPLQAAQVAADHPGLPVVLTSGGQINISGLGLADAWAALEAAPNLAVMTSGEYRRDYLEHLAHSIPERLLYASFAPVYDFRFEVRRLRSMTMSPETRRRVEGENAERLFRPRGAR